MTMQNGQQKWREPGFAYYANQQSYQMNYEGNAPDVMQNTDRNMSWWIGEHLEDSEQGVSWRVYSVVRGAV